MKPYRGKTKTNGKSGSSKRYYEWDYTHNDIEVYDRKGYHLGTAHPDDCSNMIKPKVNGRKINV
ncbi:colicin E3/pyocin S6 family cytotoxin [Nocardia cyriacigeorgica]|uniref:colicin E3/pyocin S6 family cytotoxin n=1 Tax=Nocardia cyriacigeorgica TaxID=135487 RepID=UPI0035B6A2E3